MNKLWILLFGAGGIGLVWVLRDVFQNAGDTIAADPNAAGAWGINNAGSWLFGAVLVIVGFIFLAALAWRRK